MTRTRAAIAAALATVYPGLGHVYLRVWFRAFAWFALSLAAAAVVIPPSVVSAYQAGGLDALIDASRALPTDALVAILAVRVLNVVDAAWLGLRKPRDAGDHQVPTCPNCGRELDAELEFCHWCTTPVEGSVEDSSAESRLL